MAEEKGRTNGAVPYCSLADVDPELYDFIAAEKNRQRCCIELIASENFTSSAVMDCLGSCLTNKYSEGYPGRRYYGGNEFVDEIELLCQRRALQAFRLDKEEWGVNVQPYSGSPANFEVYSGLLKPHDRIMGLSLPSGGHLTHGCYTAKKKVSATSIFFESLPYSVDQKTGLIDYDEIHRIATVYRPNLIIAGITAYPRSLDYARFRAICDDVGAYLLADMSHVAGLVAARLANDPFPYAHVVTSTTHKTMRGPRAGLIFYRKTAKHPRNANKVVDIETKIEEAVFPMLQGGPHNHQIAAIAAQMKEVMSPGWTDYCRQIKANMSALCSDLQNRGYKMVSGGTDSHLILWDLTNTDISGGKMQEVCDAVSITLNKNAVPGDASAMSPSGVRIGSPAMTSRGLKERDFQRIGDWLHKCVLICKKIQESHGRKLVEFKKGLEGNEDIAALRVEVKNWVRTFPLPGKPEI